MGLTEEEAARLKILLPKLEVLYPNLENSEKKRKLEEMMARLQQNSSAIEAKRIDKWNELKRKLDAGDFTGLPSDISILDLSANPALALPDVVVTKDVSEDQ